MSPNPHEIEIKEPPIQELNKKRSCLKRSCLTGCGCISIFLLVALGLIWFATHPRSITTKKAPYNFPTSIPIYDPDAIKSIQVISGAERSRWTAWAGYLPKFVVSPILVGLDRVSGDASPADSDIIWQKFVHLLRDHAADRRDTVRIEWENLSAQAKFIDDYYRTALRKAGYFMSAETSNSTNRQFEFSAGMIEGVLIIYDNPTQEGTETMTMIVNVP